MAEFINIMHSKQMKIAILLLVIALISIFIVSSFVTSPESTKEMIESLDEKKATVLKLSIAAAASSTALSMIPGDAAMPIANQIAELTKYFILILGAILLEKMLITVIGYVSFSYIIPFACFLGVIYLFLRKNMLRDLAIKLAIFGIVIFLAIPASIKISDLIYDSYKTSIEQTIEIAENNKEFIEEKKEDITEEDQNWFNKIGNYMSDITSKIGMDISAMVKKGEESLSAFLDAVAVLIITSCVIPLVVILIFAWVIKILFGFDNIGAIRYRKEKENNM